MLLKQRRRVNKMLITENLGEVITAEEYDFKYIVTKDEDGDYQAMVLDFPEVVLRWRHKSDEVHRSMCEASMYYAIRDYKGREDAPTHEE
jgi:hypothetical protein